MKALSQTKAQKAYAVACDACRTWAANVPVETLRYAANDRVAQSYGIKPRDASSIIANACRERGL